MQLAPSGNAAGSLCRPRYIKSLSDLEQIVVKNDRGVPVLLRDVARVELTPDERRGITEMNGEGEVVSGIVCNGSEKTRSPSSRT